MNIKKKYLAEILFSSIIRSGYLLIILKEMVKSRESLQN